MDDRTSVYNSAIDAFGLSRSAADIQTIRIRDEQIAVLKRQLQELAEEYDEEVVSHDIEEDNFEKDRDVLIVEVANTKDAYEKLKLVLSAVECVWRSRPKLIMYTSWELKMENAFDAKNDIYGSEWKLARSTK